jgi:integrase/recombinase XerD
MTTFAQLLPPGERAARTNPLRLAAAAYLARFTRLSRVHAESDLRIYVAWCTE